MECLENPTARRVHAKHPQLLLRLEVARTTSFIPCAIQGDARPGMTNYLPTMVPNHTAGVPSFGRAGPDPWTGPTAARSNPLNFGHLSERAVPRYSADPMCSAPLLHHVAEVSFRSPRFSVRSSYHRPESTISCLIMTQRKGFCQTWTRRSPLASTPRMAE